MRCPKCGTEQPESDCCVSCQVVISKYLKMMEARSAPTMYAPVPQAAPAKKPSGLRSIFKVAVLVAIVVGAVFFFKWYREEYNEKGKFGAEAGEGAPVDRSPGSTDTREYVNKHFGFKISIPVTWNIFTVDEAVSCGIIRRREGENFYLITGPWQKPDSALYIIKPDEADLFDTIDWKTFIAKLKVDGKKIIYEDVEDVGGLKVHKFAYMKGKTYKEVHIFKTPHGEVAEFYFLINDYDRNRDGLYAMREALSTLEKI